MQSQVNRVKPFHIRYMELCKSRNSTALPEIKARNKDYATLDFFGDRIRVDDWLSIFNALYYDTSLHYVAVKLRKNAPNVYENLNTIKKTRKSQGHPMILSNCLFSQFVDTISFFIGNNQNLTTLMLEGLPLRENFITYISKALSANSSIKNVSFARSCLGDEGCEIICSTIKHLSHIDCLNLTQCMLSHVGAESVAKLVKFQKIVRFSEGWEKTLRYRSVNPDTLAGLKRITLNSNAIRDEGIYCLTEVLKDDVWIKVLEVQGCQITDTGAKCIVDCLNVNNTLLMVDIEENPQISDHIADHIRTQFCYDADSSLNSSLNGITDTAKIEQKNNVQQMREKVKFVEQQLQTETFRRKQMEVLNENLHGQLIELQKKVSTQDAFRIPDGYTLIESATFEKLLQERDELSTMLKSSEKSSSPAPKQRKLKLSRTKSEILPTKFTRDISKESKSHSRLGSVFEAGSVPFLERQCGDTGTQHNEEDILKIFMTKRKTTDAMSFGDA